jgi:hypothetical protein
MATMTTQNLFCSRSFRCLLSLALLGVLAGCIIEPVGDRAYVAPVQVQADVGIEGGLVYYPDYEVYFDPGTRAYWYNHGGAWVNGPAPEGISVDVLLRSPSVRMDFRDSPANHHAEIARRYPHGWKPAPRDHPER